LEACNVLFAALSFNQRTRMEVFSAGLFDSDRRSLFTAAHSGSQPGVNVTVMCGFMTYKTSYTRKLGYGLRQHFMFMHNLCVAGIALINHKSSS
jgi:hypothetical protein